MHQSQLQMSRARGIGAIMCACLALACGQGREQRESDSKGQPPSSPSRLELPCVDPSDLPPCTEVDAHARQTYAEDLVILEQIGRQGSLLLKLLALGRPESELPGRLGAGMMLRPSLELLVDAELRLLRRNAGSMELAVVEMGYLQLGKRLDAEEVSLLVAFLKTLTALPVQSLPRSTGS